MLQKRKITRRMAKPSVCQPDTNAPAKLRDYWTNVHHIYIRCSAVIGGVKARIHVAIPHPLWTPTHRMVTIATSLV